MQSEKYYAAIFSSQRTPEEEGYRDMATRMIGLASHQPGFIGAESVAGEAGAAITISYWRSLEDIAAWRDHVMHKEAQRLGKERWYSTYRLRIAEVLEDRSWVKDTGGFSGEVYNIGED